MAEKPGPFIDEELDYKKRIPGYEKEVHGDGGWIATYTGNYIYPLHPDPEHIHIEDIAHSLSNQCRFTGHVKKFYSTAQHSVLCSYAVEDPAYRLWALLHDAGEAYLSDIARPVKRQPEFSYYAIVEDGLMDAVVERFGLSKELPMPPCVKVADNLLLWTEMRDLMPNDPPTGSETLDTEIDPWTPEYAERAFLARYEALYRL